MADLISRAAAIAKVEKARKAARTLTGMDFVMMLKDQPAVDAAPVVRCRDCKWWEKGQTTDGVKGFCPISGCCEGPEFFCADGERRDDDAVSGR